MADHRTPARATASRGAVRTLPHTPALDGFRGLAVMLVVLAHLYVAFPLSDHLPASTERMFGGGYLGVDLFFVLSGFLITALLLGELGARRVVSYKRFFARRALRLLPALYVLVLVALGYALSAGLDMRREVITTAAIVMYATNWLSVVAPEDLAPHFGHLWSLAIEEQFYFFWPAVVVGFLGVRRSWQHVAVVLGAVICSVMAWRAHLVGEGLASLDLIVRTDTRLDQLLIGALSASLWVRGATPRRGLAAAAWIGSVALLGSLAVFRLEGDALFLYGQTTVAVSAAVIILALVDSDWWARSVFEWGPLRAVGRVSYGVYLWHFPIFLGVAVGGRDLPLLVQLGLALGITTAAVTASWFLVEQPALALKRRFRPSAQAEDLPPTRTALASVRWAVTGLSAVLFGLLTGAVVGDVLAPIRLLELL